MTFKKIILPFTPDELRRMYEDEELSARQISEKFGVSKGTIEYHLAKHKIACRSKSDAGSARAKTGRRYNSLRGSDSPSWKGGRRTNWHGYTEVRKPEHPRARSNGYVFEHILVWEEHFGTVPKGAHLHHKNGVKNDNRIDNLEVLTPKAHASVIPELRIQVNALEQRVLELEAELEEMRKRARG